MDFNSVAIIGGGESGVGAALLAKSKGKDVFLSEYGILSKKYKAELTANEIPFEEKGHDLKRLKKFEIIVKSPGVGDYTEVIKGLNYYDKKIISEIEFGFYFTTVPIIGITGSNGKTTTTGLIYHLLKEAGVVAQVGGNIGKSFARLVYEDEPCEVYVLELSSFQLDGIETFRPEIAIILNITPDHLDRYEYKFENYINSKLRIVMNQREGDLLIYNGDDLSITSKLGIDNRMQDLQAVIKKTYLNTSLSMEGGDTFEIGNSTLKGMHNRFNATCAIYAVQRIGISNESIQAGLLTFENVPHRLESVAWIEEVEYVNDSKATNVDSVYYALEAMEGPVIWIAGGTDKGNVYDPILSLVKQKVKALICLGLDNEKLLTTFEEYVEEIIEVKSMHNAVQQANRLARKGDIVLLSPACASFDLFNNYEQRGDEFKKEVSKL